jgi:hypothetical protein
MFNSDEIKLYENKNKIIKNIIINKKISNLKFENLKIGQTIYIEFIPYSQKYIYFLYPKYGIIQSIHNDIIIIKNENNIEEELLHDGVSYLGNCLDYEYDLYLIE